MRSAVLLCLVAIVGVCAFTLNREDNQLAEEHLIRVVRAAQDSSSSEEVEKKEEEKLTTKKAVISGEEEDDSNEEEDTVMEKVIPTGNMIQEGSGDIEASGDRVSRDESSGFSGFGDFEGSGSGDRIARDVEVEGSGEDLFSEVVRVTREGSGDA